jgi:RNA-binding protein YhbY
MKTKISTIQIGKNGLTDGTLELLKNSFKTRENVKVVLLKSAGHTKEHVKEVAEKIQEHLGNHYTHKVIEFTISLKKWRKARQ